MGADVAKVSIARSTAEDALIDAAERLLVDVGHAGITTRRLAEAAGVNHGLVHYYFRRKPDLLSALVERLPQDEVDLGAVVVPGDVAASLHRLVDVLDRSLDSSAVLSHLLWREADTHPAVLDALHDVGDRVRLVPNRQEGGAGFMAAPWGKLTGAPGIAFVTRGPGATNARSACTPRGRIRRR